MPVRRWGLRGGLRAGLRADCRGGWPDCGQEFWLDCGPDGPPRLWVARGLRDSGAEGPADGRPICGPPGRIAKLRRVLLGYGGLTESDCTPAVRRGWSGRVSGCRIGLRRQKQAESEPNKLGGICAVARKAWFKLPSR